MQPKCLLLYGLNLICLCCHNPRSVINHIADFALLILQYYLNNTMIHDENAKEIASAAEVLQII